MKGKILFFSIVWGFHLLAKADEPPSWMPYKVTSENGAFFSWITFNDNDSTKHPWERKWSLHVYTKDSIPVWQQAFNARGYTDGMLSNDGTYFSYVEYWYYADAPVVEIYRKGKPAIRIKGEDFTIPTLLLKLTASHRLWLGDEHARYVDGPRLVIHTIDATAWSIDLETGEMQVLGLHKSYLFVLVLVFLLVLLYLMIRKKRKRSRTTTNGH